MDIDNLTVEDLAKIVQLYGGSDVAVCEHCNKIQEVPKTWFTHCLGKEYPSECRNCDRRFPICCVEKSVYSVDLYKTHPEYVLEKDGDEFYLCKKCIENAGNPEKTSKRKKKEAECYNCHISESDCKGVPFSLCKTCHEEVCDMCILNDMCYYCNYDLGFDTKGLKVGDRVIYSDRDYFTIARGFILTEATVMKVKSQHVLILCDRDYTQQISAGLWVLLTRLRKI